MTVAIGTRAGRKVELQVAVSQAHPLHGGQRAVTERSPAQIGVQNHPGGVHHRNQHGGQVDLHPLRQPVGKTGRIRNRFAPLQGVRAGRGQHFPGTGRHGGLAVFIRQTGRRLGVQQPMKGRQASQFPGRVHAKR